jgi:hypothetical protein
MCNLGKVFHLLDAIGGILPGVYAVTDVLGSQMAIGKFWTGVE